MTTQPSRRPGRPKLDDGPAISQEQIVDAAGTMFAKVGYDAMSVRELNRQLGLSQTATHHYFPTKHDLWIAAAEHNMGVVHQALRARMENTGAPDGVDGVHGSLVEFFCLHAQYPEAAKMMLHEALSAGPRLNYLYDRFVAWPRNARDAMLASDIEAGTIRWNTNTSAAILVLAHGAAVALGSPELLQLYGGPDTNDPDAVRQFAQELATTIINGIARPTQNSASRNPAERP